MQIRAISAALALASGVIGQTFLDMPASLNPNVNEGNTATNTPFKRLDARYQCFYDATEGGQSTFLCRGVTFRHDGPNFTSGNTTVYVITNLTINVGTTTKNPITDMGSVYAANLSGPLAQGFSGGLNHTADANAITGPEPWGGNNNEYSFPFATPVPL